MKPVVTRSLDEGGRGRPSGARPTSARKYGAAVVVTGLRRAVGNSRHAGTPQGVERQAYAVLTPRRGFPRPGTSSSTPNLRRRDRDRGTRLRHRLHRGDPVDHREPAAGVRDLGGVEHVSFSCSMATIPSAKPSIPVLRITRSKRAWGWASSTPASLSSMTRSRSELRERVEDVVPTGAQGRDRPAPRIAERFKVATRKFENHGPSGAISRWRKRITHALVKGIDNVDDRHR